MKEALEIRLLDRRVGELERDTDENHRFSQRLNAGEVHLGMRFEDLNGGALETSGMPCWFAHLLPQGAYRRMVEKALGVEEGDNFALLAALGEDLPGAVTAHPVQPEFSQGRPVALLAPDVAPGLRHSLAGNQLKLSVRRDERGLVMPMKGQTGEFIAKFADPSYPGLPRVEYATLGWARKAGLRIAGTEIVPLSAFEDLPVGLVHAEGHVLLSRRFDRGREGGRLHMEDFAQILDKPPGHRQFEGRYEHIAAVLGWIDEVQLREFVRHLVFRVLCGDGDAHLKNWSVLYGRDPWYLPAAFRRVRAHSPDLGIALQHDGPDFDAVSSDAHQRTVQLSPAYDVISTVVFPQVEDTLALSLNGSHRFEDVHLGSFVRLARVSRAQELDVLAEVKLATKRTVTAWREHGGALPYTPEEHARIDAHLERIPLVGECGL